MGFAAEGTGPVRGAASASFAALCVTLMLQERPTPPPGRGFGPQPIAGQVRLLHSDDFRR
jgi:hypothetical protein